MKRALTILAEFAALAALLAAIYGLAVIGWAAGLT